MAVKRAKKASGAESYFVYYRQGRWGGRSQEVHVFRVTSAGPKRMTGVLVSSASGTTKADARVFREGAQVFREEHVEMRVWRDVYDPPRFDSFDKAAFVRDRINTALAAHKARNDKLEACARAFNGAMWSSELHFRTLIEAEARGTQPPPPSAWLSAMFDLVDTLKLPPQDDKEEG